MCCTKTRVPKTRHPHVKTPNLQLATCEQIRGHIPHQTSPHRKPWRSSRISMKAQISISVRGPAALADSSQSQDSQTMAVFAKRQTAVFPQWKGSKDLPKVDGACLKTRRFHASANKVTIQFYTEGQAEGQALLSQTHPGTHRASWSEISQVPASASANAWPGLHRRHGCSSRSDDKLVQVMFLTCKLSL